MTSPTLVTARFYEPERHRLEQALATWRSPDSVPTATRGIAAAHHALRYTEQYTAQPTADADVCRPQR
jgi:hypothetical protein